jgi:hypothetical protein
VAPQARTGRQKGHELVNDCTEQTSAIESQKNDERILLAVLFCLGVADAIVTRYIVSAGLGSEGNPWLKNLAGSDNLVAVKALGTFLAVVLLFQLYNRRPRLVRGVTIGAVAWYTLVVLWNVLVVLLGSSTLISISR